jgi:hypothetical protein
MKLEFIFFLIMIQILSCKKQVESRTSVGGGYPNADIYVTGSVNTGGVEVASYWKNGVRFTLGDGTHNSFASDVFVLGKDVYVAGSETNESNILVAKIWKNGIVSSLSNGLHSATATKLFIVSDNVYVAGEEETGVDFNGMAGSIVKVWKNGVASNITDGTMPALLNTLYVSGNDTYVTTSEYDLSYTPNCKIWKNGVVINTTGSNMVNSIQVKNDVFHFLTFTGSDYFHWINGQPTKLTLPRGSRTINSLGMSNSFLNDKNEVIIVGSLLNVDSALTIWVNSQRSSFLIPSEPTLSVLHYYLYKDVVYSTGTVGRGLPVIWRNGELLDYLEEEPVTNISSIFVSPK